VDALLRHINDDGHVVAIDFAIVNAVGVGHIADAARGPGAAATAYEQVKRDKYAAAAQSDAMPFIPFVLDAFGGMGASCGPLFQRIVARWGKRYNLPGHHATAIAQHRLAFVVARGVARLLLVNIAAVESDDEADE
jgi:hypothetical protein